APRPPAPPHRAVTEGRILRPRGPLEMAQMPPPRPPRTRLRMNSTSAMMTKMMRIVHNMVNLPLLGEFTVPAGTGRQPTPREGLSDPSPCRDRVAGSVLLVSARSE